MKLPSRDKSRRNGIAVLLFFGLAACSPVTASSPDALCQACTFLAPAKTTTASSQFDILSTATQQTHRIQVAVPPPVSSAETSLEYPVIYLLDANGYFDLFVDMVRLLTNSGDLPPMVIVGVGYPVDTFAQTIPLRLRDYSPVRDIPHEKLVSKLLNDPEISTGKAPAFLAFINTELKPVIEARYPVDSKNAALFGHSLGGLFALHVLLEAPDSFTSYCILSPAIVWGQNEILDRAHKYVNTHDDLDASVFMAIGDRERSLAAVLGLPAAYKEDQDQLTRLLGNPDPVNLVQQFSDLLIAQNYTDLEMGPLRILPETNHDAAVIPGLSAGLLALFGLR